MIVLGIDPGPVECGSVLYDTDASRPISSVSAMDVDGLLEVIASGASFGTGLVAIERVQSYGIAGADLLRTSEVVGRLWQRAKDSGIPVALLYRRDVLRFLDVTGKGSHDARVRQRLIEMFGGSREVSVGSKRKPGPLFGVSGHAWQALAVAVTAAGGTP